MNTPAHMIMACLYVRKETPKLLGIALLGGLTPDFSLYFLTIWSRFVQNISFQRIFDELYFSNKWQTIFAIDNSFFVWAAVLGLGFILAKEWIKIFAAGALTHIALDFPLHHDDGRAHFWPVSDWVFESPISYWDNNHYAGIVAPIELLLVAAMIVLLWRRFFPNPWVFVIAALGALQILPSIMFRMMF